MEGCKKTSQKLSPKVMKKMFERICSIDTNVVEMYLFSCASKKMTFLGYEEKIEKIEKNERKKRFSDRLFSRKTYYSQSLDFDSMSGSESSEFDDKSPHKSERNSATYKKDKKDSKKRSSVNFSADDVFNIFNEFMLTINNIRSCIQDNEENAKSLHTITCYSNVKNMKFIFFFNKDNTMILSLLVHCPVNPTLLQINTIKDGLENEANAIFSSLSV